MDSIISLYSFLRRISSQIHLMNDNFLKGKKTVATMEYLRAVETKTHPVAAKVARAEQNIDSVGYDE